MNKKITRLYLFLSRNNWINSNKKRKWAKLAEGIYLKGLLYIRDIISKYKKGGGGCAGRKARGGG
ncbi:hypothetical protein, partial [Bacteroides fragilis]|uniref:hypothetical protein n=1 Tax=Bacteroides fragilis TaxID=817 RepID=UPI0022AB05FF